MGQVKDISGQRFGRWTVGTKAPVRPGEGAFWHCVCDCGVARTVSAHNILSGTSQSCGCLQRETTSARATHRRSLTPVYRVWVAMKQRCQLPTDRSYPNYGGRGITVCERWQSFAAFYADMGDPPKGLTLERRDNNAGYSLENCYWATRTEQRLNQRQKLYTVGGITLTAKQWAAKLGGARNTVNKRLAAGWSVEDACTKPTRLVR